MKFIACLDALEKSAGLLDAAKRVALTEVPGTKPWFIGAKKPVSDGLKNVARPATRPSGTRRLASGAYDVSDLAAKMGIK